MKAAVLRVPEAAASALRALQPEGTGTWLHALARTLGTSAAWALTGAKGVIVRPDPVPLLGFIGDLTDADLARFDALKTQLDELPDRLQFLDWVDVEKAIERLADLLVDAIGRPNLDRARFVGIPRGGLVVVGLLAVRLGLEAGALDDETGSTVVVVDDCIVSGRRLRRWMEEHQHADVVVAVLASHPDARSAIRRTASQVRAVVSARDLVDHAPRVQGHGYQAWQERWREQQPDDWWTGQPDIVAFPWNEPDTAIWNPVTRRIEPGWRVLPGSRCIKNRPPAGTPSVPIARQSSAVGPLVPPPDVVSGRIDDAVYVLRAGANAIRLVRSAADMWEAILSSGRREDAARALATRYGASVSDVHEDVDRFATTLAERGYLIDTSNLDDQPGDAIGLSRYGLP